MWKLSCENDDCFFSTWQSWCYKDPIRKGWNSPWVFQPNITRRSWVIWSSPAQSWRMPTSGAFGCKTLPSWKTSIEMSSPKCRYCDNWHYHILQQIECWVNFDKTSNDIIAGNGRERFMIAIKFSMNIWSF